MTVRFISYFLDYNMRNFKYVYMEQLTYIIDHNLRFIFSHSDSFFAYKIKIKG